MVEKPRVEYADESCMLVTWRAIAFPVFGHRIPTPAAARSMALALEKHGKATGQGRMVELTLLDPNVPNFPPEVRKELEAMVPRCSPYFACVGTLFQGVGFRAAVVRAVVTGFQMLSRHPYPQRLFSTPESCADWTYPIARSKAMKVDEPNEILGAILAVLEEGERRGMLTPVNQARKVG